MAEIQPLFSDQQPAEVQQKPKVEAEYVRALLGVAWNICSARMLGLLAVMGALVIFGYAVYEPLPWRTYTAGAYAVLVLVPLIILYHRRG